MSTYLDRRRSPAGGVRARNSRLAPPLGGIAPTLTILLLGLLLAGGCGEGGEPTTARAEHPWINLPTGHDDKAVTLPAWLIFPIDDARREEAINELATESYIQISPSMATHYSGQEVRIPPEMRPFLVRGVGAPDSALTVIQSLDGLWIKSAVHPTQSISHRPLVVLLDPTPRDIFVTVE